MSLKRKIKKFDKAYFFVIPINFNLFNFTSQQWQHVLKKNRKLKSFTGCQPYQR